MNTLPGRDAVFGQVMLRLSAKPAVMYFLWNHRVDFGWVGAKSGPKLKIYYRHPVFAKLIVSVSRPLKIFILTYL